MDTTPGDGPRSRRPAAQKVAFGLVAALVIAAAFLAGALSGNDDSASASAQARCVELRKEWASVVTDFSAAQAVQRRYDGAGCQALCGDLVEDTDTPVRETRCGDDAVEADVAPPLTTVAQRELPPETPAYDSKPVATSTPTAPEIPSRIPGYEPNGPPVRLTLRLFDDQPTVIDDFPVTMNGCLQGLSTTRWRSLAADVEAAVTSYPADPSNPDPDPSDIRDATVGRAGLVRTEHQCDQPVFTARGTSGILDVVVEYQAWTASP